MSDAAADAAAEQQPAPGADDSTELDKSGSPAAAQQDTRASEAAPAAPRCNGTLSKDKSEQRQIEILKTVVQYKNGQIFEWGQKAKVLEQCLEPLNSLPIFSRGLKINTLKDRWRKAEKMAEEIMGNMEKFVKLSENGGKEMSELDKLYFNLAKRMKKFKDAKENEKAEAEANAKDVQHRLTAAMHGVARRCGYSDISQAEKLLREEEADSDEEEGEESKEEKASPNPEDVKGKKHSPSVQPYSGEKGEKGEKGGLYGSGTSQGQQKRAKGNPALNLDCESSQDPLSSIAQGGDCLMTFLESQANGDKEMMAELAKSQKMQAQAERLKQAAAAADAFVKAQQNGVELPPCLMALFNAQD